MDNTTLAAEVVKLKQEVAGLRAAIEKLEEIVGGTVNSLGGYYSGSVLKPLDDGFHYYFLDEHD